MPSRPQTQVIQPASQSQVVLRTSAIANMARELKTRKSDGRVTIVESPAAGKRFSPRRQDSPRKVSYYATKKNGSLAAQEPGQEPPIYKEENKAYKGKQTVSVAGIFKKVQKAKSSRASKKYQRAKEPTPEIDLVGDLHSIHTWLTIAKHIILI